MDGVGERALGVIGVSGLEAETDSDGRTVGPISGVVRVSASSSVMAAI